MRRITLLIVGLITPILTANISAVDMGSNDRDNTLEGKWELVSVLYLEPGGGAPVVSSFLNHTGPTMIIDGRGVHGYWSGWLWVNPAASPRQFELRGSRTERQPARMAGIYSRGQDWLIICVAEPGQERTKDLDQKPYVKHYMFERAK